MASSSPLEARVREALRVAKATLEPRALRAYALIVGAAVADAAAVDCHWQYDTALLREALGGSEPAFAATPLNPFYRVGRGRHSCYGDQFRVFVGSLARTGGVLDAAHAARALRRRMTAADYEATAAERANRAAYADDQRAAAPPVAGPWRHGTVERFVAGEPPNDTDASADALLRALPVAAAYAALGGGVDDEALPAGLLPDVDAAVGVTQASPAARAHARSLAIAAARLVSGAARTVRAAVEAAAAESATFRDCLAAADAGSWDESVDALAAPGGEARRKFIA